VRILIAKTPRSCELIDGGRRKSEARSQNSEERPPLYR
jgi:hypothetical protein